jgi:hypothetical protein
MKITVFWATSYNDRSLKHTLLLLSLYFVECDITTLKQYINVSLALGLILVTNEPLQVKMWNLVWRYIS